MMISLRTKLFAGIKNNVGSIVVITDSYHLNQNKFHVLPTFKHKLHYSSSSTLRKKTSPIPPPSHLQHENDRYYPILIRSPQQSLDTKQKEGRSRSNQKIGSKSSRSGALKISLFLLAHAIPIGSLVYAFTVLTSIQQADDEYVSGETAEEVIQDTLKIIRVSKGCFCLLNNSDFPNAYQLEPHFPEEKVLRLPEEQIIPGIQNNIITDVIAGKYSEFSLPLNFVHFALNAKSLAHKEFQNDRRISLLYYDSDRKITILMSGLAAIVSSKESKRHYWRSEWGQHFDNHEAPDYILVKFVPQNVKIQRRNGYSKEIERTVNENTIDWKLISTID